MKKIFIKNWKKISKIYLLQTIIISLVRILVPIPYYKITETIARIIIYKKALGLRIEKVLVAECLCIINYVIEELICIKIYEEVYHIFSFTQAISNFGFICSVAITVLLMQIIIYKACIRFKFIIN